jgi:hypothetical protein
MTDEETKEREQQVKRELREKLAGLFRSWAVMAEKSDQWDHVQDTHGAKIHSAALTEDVGIMLRVDTRWLCFQVTIKRPVGAEPCPPNPTG